MRSCIMPGQPTHLEQALNVGTVVLLRKSQKMVNIIQPLLNEGQQGSNLQMADIEISSLSHVILNQIKIIQHLNVLSYLWLYHYGGQHKFHCIHCMSLNLIRVLSGLLLTQTSINMSAD